MKNLFEKGRAEEVKARVSALRADSQRRWGKMSPSEALAHCAVSLETAVGDSIPPRMFIGRIIGGFVKPKALGDDAPMMRNSPTVPAFVTLGTDPQLESERARLIGLIDRFVAAGPSGCTKHPHSFFGRLSGEEWSILMYKHLDHHLRQFGA